MKKMTMREYEKSDDDKKKDAKRGGKEGTKEDMKQDRAGLKKMNDKKAAKKGKK